MCCCERSFVRILFSPNSALVLNLLYMPSSLSQGGFLGGAPSVDLHWFPITAIILYRKVKNSWISQNFTNGAITGFLLCGSFKVWCRITLHWDLLTLFIVKPWRFLRAAARHLSSARAWFATGSTAGQEACNYSSLQRCQSVKDGIHAFILANPSRLPLSCLLTFPPPTPLPHLPPFPPTLKLV